MRIKRLGVVGALASSLVLSGCAGAMMAMGPGALPFAMMAAGPMEELGLFDALDDITAAEKNPALRNHPALADASLSARQAELIRRHAVFSADLDRRLASAGAIDCALDSETRWILAQGMTESEYEASMATLSADIRPRSLTREAALLEGDCVEGKPEGAFVAVTRHESAQGSGATAIWSAERRRLQGTMLDGVLEGEMQVDSVSEAQSTSVGLVFRNITHAHRTYEGGVPTGQQLTVGFSYDKEGEMTQVTTTVQEVLSPSQSTVTVYAGDSLFQEYSLLDGQTHGWMVMHPTEFVKGYPSDGSRTCYRYGQQAPDSACGPLST